MLSEAFIERLVDIESLVLGEESYEYLDPLKVQAYEDLLSERKDVDLRKEFDYLSHSVEEYSFEMLCQLVQVPRRLMNYYSLNVRMFTTSALKAKAINQFREAEGLRATVASSDDLVHYTIDFDCEARPLCPHRHYMMEVLDYDEIENLIIEYFSNNCNYLWNRRVYFYNSDYSNLKTYEDYYEYFAREWVFYYTLKFDYDHFSDDYSYASWAGNLPPPNAIE